MDETTRQELAKLADWLDEELDGETGHDRGYVMEHILFKLDSLLGQEPRAREAFDEHGNLM